MKIYKCTGTCVLLASVEKHVEARSPKDAIKLFKKAFAKGHASIDADNSTACELVIGDVIQKEKYL